MLDYDKKLYKVITSENRTNIVDLCLGYKVVYVTNPFITVGKMHYRSNVVISVTDKEITILKYPSQIYSNSVTFKKDETDNLIMFLLDLGMNSDVIGQIGKCILEEIKNYLLKASYINSK